MQNFVYHAPTKVFFGKDTHKQVGEIVAGYGFKKIMLHYGQQSIKKSGLYDEICAGLAQNGIEVVDFGGVQPNPTVELVREAIKVAKATKVELILAVGGGSAIDSAKYTAVGAKTDRDVWDFSCKLAEPTEALPVACVLTMAAAGSEMSGSAVISNTALHEKRGYGSPLHRCLFAICNPELTYTVPPYQTACGIVDILAHTMERYFTLCAPTPLTDRLAEGVLTSVIDAGKVLLRDPKNYQARATVMWGSSLSHNDLTGCGRENFLAVHQLEHALSGEFPEIAHGAGLAVLFPAWGRYMYKQNLPRFANFARRVWGVNESDDAAAALAGIEAMADYFKTIGMPGRLREFGIPKDSLPKLADLCSFGGTRVIKNFIPMDYKVVLEIFESCY